MMRCLEELSGSRRPAGQAEELQLCALGLGSTVDLHDLADKEMKTAMSINHVRS